MLKSTIFEKIQQNTGKKMGILIFFTAGAKEVVLVRIVGIAILEWFYLGKRVMCVVDLITDDLFLYVGCQLCWKDHLVFICHAVYMYRFRFLVNIKR